MSRKSVTSQLPSETLTKIQQLLRENPTKKPSEILVLLEDSGYAVRDLTAQGVSAIKRKLPEATGLTVTPAPSKAVEPEKPQQSRFFKNLRTKEKYEVKPGEPPRHFTLSVGKEAFSLDDFVALIRKHCGEVVEIDPNDTIREIPLESLSIDDIFKTN
jgi:hypothetical protein